MARASGAAALAAYQDNPAGRWLAVNALHGTVDAALDRALRREHALSVRELGALEILSTQDDDEGGHFQMRELARGLDLSQSATTRLVTRLEERGMLTRYICPTDRRGVYTDVTAAGEHLLSRARPTRDAALAEVLGSAADDRLAPLVRLSESAKASPERRGGANPGHPSASEARIAAYAGRRQASARGMMPLAARSPSSSSVRSMVS